MNNIPNKPLAFRADYGETYALMLSQITPETVTKQPVSTRNTGVVPEITLNTPAKPIAEFASHADFPKNALGETVDIGGFVGVVVNIVNQSIKVRSAEGITQSFNTYRLRTIYAPAVRPEIEPITLTSEYRKTPVETEKPVAKREFIENPDYNAPIKPIREYASRAEFPACAYGMHVDIAGFGGVVVEIVGQSLKVRSADGQTRSYNAAVLKNLYGSSK